MILGRELDKPLPFWGGIKNFFAMTSLSLIAPGRLGDLGLAYYWRKFLDPGETLAVVFLDKILTLIWLFSLGIYGLIEIFQIDVQRDQVVLISGLLFLTTLFIYIIFSKVDGWKKYIPNRLKEVTAGFSPSLFTICLESKRSLFIGFCLTGLRIFLYSIGFWMLLLAMGEVVAISSVIFILAVVQLSSIVPISIMGLGVVESVWVFGLSKQGVEPSVVLAASIIGRVVTIILLTTFFSLFALEKIEK